MKSGAELKRTGMHCIAARSRPWCSRATAAIVRMASGTHFTAEDLRKRIKGDPPHQNAWGTILHNAARDGLVIRTGWQQSQRPEAHSRVLAIWCRQ